VAKWPINQFPSSPEVRSALQLLALTFTRPGELRLATWKEFDLAAGDVTTSAGRFSSLGPVAIFAYSYRSTYRFFRISNLDPVPIAELNER
jgi:integrase